MVAIPHCGWVTIGKPLSMAGVTSAWKRGDKVSNEETPRRQLEALASSQKRAKIYIGA